MPCAPFYIYIFSMLCAALFTQTLRSPISAMLYIFMITIPFASLLLLFIAGASVTVYLGSGQEYVPRGEPVTVTLKLVNSSPLPIYDVQAELSIPEPSGRPSRSLTLLSLSPFGGYSVDRTLVFNYRGEYEIGVSSIFVRDLFGMFRLRADAGTFASVFVLPRERLLLSDPLPASPDETSLNAPRLRSSDHTGQQNIREYSDGDSLRDIHWKLSAKSEEMLVREYSSPAGCAPLLILLTDTDGLENLGGGSFSFDEDAAQYALNEISEAALSIASSLLEEGGCTVCFAERGRITSLRVNERDDYSRLFTAMTSLGASDTDMSALIGDNDGYILVTARPDGEALSLLETISSEDSENRGLSSVCVIDMSPRISRGADEYELYNRECKSRLSAAGAGISSLVFDGNEE